MFKQFLERQQKMDQGNIRKPGKSGIHVAWGIKYVRMILHLNLFHNLHYTILLLLFT